MAQRADKQNQTPDAGDQPALLLKRRTGTLKKKPKLEDGALDKYVVKGPQTNSENQTPDANIDGGQDVNAIEVEVVAAEIQEGDHGHCDNAEEVEVTATEIGESSDVNICDEDHDPNILDDMNNSVQPDIFDPRNWDGLDPKKIDILRNSMWPVDILEILMKRPFNHNALIAYRILLTIYVTVATAERSLLKLLKSYLRSTMAQEKLNGLATIALENDVLEKINYEDIIEDFISRNTRRMTLFNRA
ncbi:hAT family dimerization domain protein [Hordeum vulgare]|nr:hAT family dimerization domain protein [Hordeum vulgare]